MPSKFGAGTGIVIEWFELFGGYSDQEIVPEMERDRLEYAERPGFIRKLLVVGDNPAGGDLAGGVYYLRDLDCAGAFLHWASEVHRDLGGRLFEDREYVGQSHGYVCELLGHVGLDFFDPHPGAVRIQRLEASTLGRSELLAWWTSMCPAIEASGLLGVSFGYHADTASAFIVSVSGIRSAGNVLSRDSLEQLANFDPAASLIAQGEVLSVEDLNLWVHTVWEGYSPGSVPPDAAWPNSPPLPCADYWLEKTN